MADNESEGATHVMAPPPKMYYKQYTNLAVANNTTPPPPPPPIGEYSAFGITHNPDDPRSILSSLKEHGVTQLYSDAADNIKELKKLKSSLLISFLDLLDVLIQCPTNPIREKKIEDLELLFINFHHLVNTFRPHQALETLIQMIKIQKDQKLNLVEQINSKMEVVRTGLLTTINSLPALLPQSPDCKVECTDEDMETDKHSEPEIDALLSSLDELVDRELGG